MERIGAGRHEFESEGAAGARGAGSPGDLQPRASQTLSGCLVLHAAEDRAGVPHHDHPHHRLDRVGEVENRDADRVPAFHRRRDPQNLRRCRVGGDEAPVPGTPAKGEGIRVGIVDRAHNPRAVFQGQGIRVCG